MGNKLNLTRSEINSLYPVSGVDVYSRALVLKRFSRQDQNFISHTHLRGKIERLSSRSRTNFVLTVMRSRISYVSLLTLSYGQNYPRDGKEVKKDLNAFLVKLRREFGPVKYFWFMEFQERGAPHFHMGLNIGPPQDEDRRIVADCWCRIAEKYDFLYSPVNWKKSGPKKFSSGISTREAVRAVHEYHEQWQEIREFDGAIRYIIAYATKPHQKTVPPDYSNVGRFWYASKGSNPEVATEFYGTDKDVKELLRELGRNFDKWELLPRVIFF